MTKLRAMTKEQLHKMIALLVAVCMILPSLYFAAEASPMMALSSSVSHKTQKEVETSKTATLNEDGSYHIKIEAYSTASSLQTVPTDTVLVLERSSKMSDVLYTRDKTNLLTYELFSGSSLESHNSMFDEDNPDNEYFLGLHFSVNTTYSDNKYVLDPNTPDTYIYLCQTYITEVGWGITNHYTYSIVDTQGNKYESQDFTQSLSRSTLEALTKGLLSALSSIDFTWAGNVYHPEYTTYADYVAGTGLSATKQTFTVNRVYQRSDNNATNENLWNNYKNYGGLWIKDDEGELCEVHMARYDKNFNQVADTVDDDDVAYYLYTTTDSTGKDYYAIYGNPVYGGKFSVFQGFKSYDSTGTVDHANSIEHKTLFNGTSQDVTKLLAMQEGVEDFILKVHKNAYDNGLTDGQQKIGVVSYASRSEFWPSNWDRLSKIEYELTDVYSESNAYTMIKSVYALEANGRRRIDVGMEYAKDVLDSGSASTHKVNVIAFTTGMPSTDINGSFKTDVANEAITNSRAIEAAYPNADIYTIGMYDLADSNQLYGNWFYRMSHSNIACDGSVGSMWGGTALSSATNTDMDERDAAATNRFLNYMSSNFRNATSIGLYGPAWLFPTSGLSTGGTGYQITSNSERTDDGYYYGAQDADEMIEAFNLIAENIRVPLSTLGTETQLVDEVSDYFNIKGNVSAYTMQYNGTGDLDSASSWSKVNNSDLTTTTSNGGKTVTVTGFDYSGNYCSPNENAGQKVVLEFDVDAIDGFLGGHDVPTNEGSSAVIDKNGTTVETLPYPEVDVALDKSLTTNDQYIYYSYEADLSSLFDVSPYAQGLTNDFVDVTYELFDPDADDASEPVMTYTVLAGEDEGTSSLADETKANQYPVLEANKTYQVKVTVSTIDEDTDDRETATNTKDATVYVYKPTLTVKDSEKSYDEATAGVDLNENRVSVTWSAEDTDVAAPSENVPTLEYTFYDASTDTKTVVSDPTNVTLDTTTDYNVEVTIKGHSFSYDTLLPYYLKSDGSSVLVSEYEGDNSDLVPITYTYEDEDGNESTVTLTDDAGNTIYTTFYRTTTVNADKGDVKDADKAFTTYVNQTDDSKTNNNTEGNFTIYTGKAFDLYLSKIFSGDFAAPEGVIFTLTGSDGTSQTITFDESDFTGQKSGEKKASASLKTGITYTLVESYADESTDPLKYDTTATQKVDSGEAQVLADMNEDDAIANFQFTISGDTDLEKYTIVVTNTDTEEAPPMTGLSFSEHGGNMGLLLGALAVAVVLGGGIALYKVRHEDEQA